jgi:hypothetical protein
MIGRLGHWRLGLYATGEMMESSMIAGLLH